MREKKLQILEQAIEIAAFDGWSDKTMLQASNECGFEENYAKIVFPRGIADLVDFFMREIDSHMSNALEKAEVQKMRIRDRIGFAVKTRLDICAEYKLAIKQAVSFFAMPQNIAFSLKSLYKTVDCIWYACGDDASDFNHYTKRATLAAVYSSTVLYWINDNSDENKNTWQFLNRRINNVMQFHKAKADVMSFFKKLPC